LHDIEYLATLASIHAKDYKYPKKNIDDMWENVLLCQFHDVLPGSSIEMVYEDASAVYPFRILLRIALREGLQYRTTTAQRSVECIRVQR
jgi:Alpha mannosidase middle domain